MSAQIGDFVTARIMRDAECVQGVLIRTFCFSCHVETTTEVYACAPNPTVVADKDIWLPEVMEHVQKVRRRLGIEG